MDTEQEMPDPVQGRNEALSRLQAQLKAGLASTGQTVTWLANRAGPRRTTVSNALNQPSVPSARTVAGMAKALRLDVAALLKLRDEAEQAQAGEGSGTPEPSVSTVSAPTQAGDGGQGLGQPGLLVGVPPLAASAYQPREVLRERIDAAREGGGVVLTQARHASAGVLSGMGGVGKSQLAAQYAHQAVAGGTGLVVWVPAGESAQIVTLYAQAGQRVGAAGATGEDPGQDARAFLEWLATTDRTWLVVLDDVGDPATVGPWWPPARPGTGWTLATTRLHDPRLTGGGRTRIDIDVYTAQEALAYIRERVTGDGGLHLLDGREDDVARALGYLPLALGHAAAYLLSEEISCADYLVCLDDKALRLEDVLPEWSDTEGYQRQVTAALLLSLSAAEQAGPEGIIMPLVRMLALLSPDGHPESLWATPSFLKFLTTADGQAAEVRAAEEKIMRALRVLRRYALISTDPHTPHRQIRMHALTARAIRESTPILWQPGLAHIAASALDGIWPHTHMPRELVQTLRANTAVLRRHADQHLWRTGSPHPLLFAYGLGLRAAGLHQDAHNHWLELVERATATLGGDSECVLVARSHLAANYIDLGRHRDALTLYEAVRTDAERILGPEHPGALAARANLAVIYLYVGRHHEALTLQEAVLADRERVLGPDHHGTLTARSGLASVYRALGRYHDALTLEEALLVEHERLAGPDHPDTLHARSNLVATYNSLGRHRDALTLQEAVLADTPRILGPGHPDILRAFSNLAVIYSDLGRHRDVLASQEFVLAEVERLHGTDHPDTLHARSNLAVAYNSLGRHRDALTLQEAVLADTERVLGPDHPITFAARDHLAAIYRDLGRPHEALVLDRGVLADRERILGPDHPDTIRTRTKLANPPDAAI